MKGSVKNRTVPKRYGIIKNGIIGINLSKARPVFVPPWTNRFIGKYNKINAIEVRVRNIRFLNNFPKD